MINARLVGLLTVAFLVSAILCGTMAGTQESRASDIPDCHSRSAPSDNREAQPDSLCPSTLIYELTPKRTDFFPDSAFSTLLPQTTSFHGWRTFNAHNQKTAYFKPKEKLYLFVSVLIV
jgi:hypothetical protein